MSLHPSTFDYLAPTDQQIATLAEVRQKLASLAADLDRLLPDGADKTYLLCKLREWAIRLEPRLDDYRIIRWLPTKPS